MDVKLPELGEGADAGVVVTLLVKEGDEVSEGQTLLELENEKAVAPIPAPASGTVSKIRVREGDRVSVGHVLMTIGSTSGAAANPDGTAAEATRAKRRRITEVEIDDEDEDRDESHEARASSQTEAAAAPSVRRLARELGIDLTRVRGSERGGRIVIADVRAYVLRLQEQVSRRKTTVATPAPAGETGSEQIDFSKWGAITKAPISSLRQVISRRMLESWTTIPHVTQFDQADVTALMELRKKYAAAYETKGARLTLTSFVLRAVAATLQRHPIFNASLDEANGELVLKQYYHIGIAVDTEAGLLVPIIRDVNRKDLVQLSKELNEMAAKARERKLSLDELKGGSFTISNQGGIGGGPFTPIVNKPEVAILGLGRSLLKPVVRNGTIESRMMLPMAVSYDHRVIDGGSAARFTVDLVKALENFSEDEVKT